MCLIEAATNSEEERSQLQHEVKGHGGRGLTYVSVEGELHQRDQKTPR